MSRTAISVQRAGPDGVDAALHIWREANRARGKVPSDQRVDRVRAKLVDPVASVIVAARGIEVVGMALAEPGRDQEGAGQPLPDLCHLSMLFVHPDHWGNRIGEELLVAVARDAAERGRRTLQVWTGQGNQRAQRLYLRFGFGPSGRVQELETGESVIHLVHLIDVPAHRTDVRAPGPVSAEVEP